MQSVDERIEVPGKNIRYYRNIKKLTQEELADRCRCARQTIMNAEKCNRMNGISVLTLLYIAEALDVEIGTLFISKSDSKSR